MADQEIESPSGPPRRPKEQDEERMVLSGASRTIAYARQNNGNMPAKEYLENLEKPDKTRFITLFTYLAEFGKISNDDKFHPSVGKILCDHDGKTTTYAVGEFKVHSGSGKRIMACLDGRKWVLTHGFPKGRDVATERERAGRIFCEDRSRRLRAAKSGRDA